MLGILNHQPTNIWGSYGWLQGERSEMDPILFQDVVRDPLTGVSEKRLTPQRDFPGQQFTLLDGPPVAFGWQWQSLGALCLPPWVSGFPQGEPLFWWQNVLQAVAQAARVGQVACALQLTCGRLWPLLTVLFHRTTMLHASRMTLGYGAFYRHRLRNGLSVFDILDLGEINLFALLNLFLCFCM